MYTRCPHCSSTFRINEAVLQAADGDVQCGSCDKVFNALDALFDDSGAVISSGGAAARPAGPNGAVDEALEFNAPEQDWQRFFIEPEEPAAAEETRAEPELGPDFDELTDDDTAAADADEAPDDDPPLSREPPSQEQTASMDLETADTDTWRQFLRDAGPEESAEPPLYVIAGDADDAGIVAGREATQEDEAKVSAAASAEPAEPGETILDWNPTPAFTQPAPRSARHTAGWAAASIIAIIALAAQALHQFRDDLAADPAYGAGIRALYDSLGRPLYPAWPLDAYEMRGAKAIVENSAPGALDIIAEIAVTGRQPVGLPMVRVVLRDRWSNPLASGVFDSATYLAGAPSPSRVYPAGTLIPVAISLKDPGMTAQGYEIDVCLPNRHFGLQCKTARDPFRR